MRKRVFYNPVIGDKATLIKTAEETGGETTLIEVVVNPGGGNVLHRHVDYAERFEVLDGNLSVTLGTQKLVLQPGESVIVPANVLHCFNNHSSRPVKFRVQFNPGQSGFERAIAIGYGLAADGLVDKKSMPRKLRHQAVLLAMSGIVPAGFVKLLLPVFRLIASKSRDVEEELIKKYC